MFSIKSSRIFGLRKLIVVGTVVLVMGLLFSATWVWATSSSSVGGECEEQETGVSVPVGVRIVEPPVTGAGVTHGAISGVVFNDGNKNGVQDTGEGEVPGVTVTLSQDGKVVSTTLGGSYSFPYVPAGTYIVSIAVPSGYEPTTSTSVTVTLLGGEHKIVIFGLVEVPVVGAYRAAVAEPLWKVLPFTGFKYIALLALGLSLVAVGVKLLKGSKL